MVSMLKGFFAKREPETPPAAVVARRVESDRARKAHADASSEQRRAALAFAQTLGRVSEPMTPRAQIAAEVFAERQARKARP